MRIRPMHAFLVALVSLPLIAQQPAGQPAKAPNIPDTFTNLIVLPTTYYQA